MLLNVKSGLGGDGDNTVYAQCLLQPETGQGRLQKVSSPHIFGYHPKLSTQHVFGLGTVSVGVLKPQNSCWGPVVNRKAAWQSGLRDTTTKEQEKVHQRGPAELM